VQEVAAGIWRQRRLLMFENCGAFQLRDDSHLSRHEPATARDAPLCMLESEIVEADDVFKQAGLGLDLPSEPDTVLWGGALRRFDPRQPAQRARAVERGAAGAARRRGETARRPR